MIKKVIPSVLFSFVIFSATGQFFQAPDQNTLILSRILKTNMNNLMKSSRTNLRTVQLAKTASETKNTIEGLLKLQTQIRSALKNTQNIAGLRFTDIDFLAEKVIGVSIDPADYMANTPYTNEFIEKYRTVDADATTAKAIYSIIHRPFTVPVFGDKKSPSSKNEDSFARLKSHAELLKAAGAMQGEKRIQAALLYKQWAMELEERALELNEIIKTDDFLSMSEADRLLLQAEALNMLEKSMTYKLKADELLLESPGLVSEAEKRYEAGKAFREWMVAESAKNEKKRKTRRTKR